jgi:hypothetical protein
VGMKFAASYLFLYYFTTKFPQGQQPLLNLVYRIFKNLSDLRQKMGKALLESKRKAPRGLIFIDLQRQY